MERALIIGDSGGIGAAVSQALVAKGVEVTGLSRRSQGLDVTDEASVIAHFSKLDGPFDLIFVATGALTSTRAQPEKALSQLGRDEMMGQFLVNSVGPALVMKHAYKLLPRHERGVFAVLSARVGSIGDNGLGGWYSYRASKAAVNQLVKTGAIEIARSHRHAICVALHPGTVATAFTQGFTDRHPHVSASKAAANLLRVIGQVTPADTGGFFDWSGAEVPW